MTIGGSRESFWNLTPRDLSIDMKAFRRRNQDEMQKIWLQGWYFQKALQSTILVCGLADKKVIRDMPKYPEMPLTEQEAENEKRKEAQLNLFIAKMDRWRKINNSRNKK